MWIFSSKRALWHCYETEQPGRGLCGATVANPGEEREQASRPVGFDGLICNQCWFRLELNQTLATIPEPSIREWLAALNFSSLAEPEIERLCAELGENRALSLIVIHGLAAGSEVERAIAPTITPIAVIRTASDLSVIPLASRGFLPAEVSEQESAESVEEPESPVEPRLKINCSRIPAARNGTGGLGRFFRR